MSTFRMPQPSHHRVVLPIVAREVNERKRHTCFIDQSFAHFETVVWASIIDQYNFVATLDRKFLERANPERNRVSRIRNAFVHLQA